MASVLTSWIFPGALATPPGAVRRLDDSAVLLSHVDPVNDSFLQDAIPACQRLVERCLGRGYTVYAAHDRQHLAAVFVRSNSLTANGAPVTSDDFQGAYATLRGVRIARGTEKCAVLVAESAELAGLMGWPRHEKIVDLGEALRRRYEGGWRKTPQPREDCEAVRPEECAISADQVAVIEEMLGTDLALDAPAGPEAATTEEKQATPPAEPPKNSLFGWLPPSVASKLEHT